MSMEKGRRNFLKVGAGTAGALLLASSLSKASETCGPTPPQTAGPFYPGEANFKADSDLTKIIGHTERALGQVVYIHGTIVDAQCRPIENANVEIWQACASGRYNNHKDSNPAPLDPNFKYWGEAFTGKDGHYMFKTIIPGAYPADKDWTRPPHIHFKISCLGYRELVTQMYFKGDALNERDLILRDIPAGERNSVIVEFRPSPHDLEPGSLIGDFNITLRRVRA